MLLASGGTAGADDEQWLVVPGKRFGPVTATSTAASLTASLGAEHVQNQRVYTGEGVFQEATVLYPASPEESAVVVWGDPEARTRPTMVAVGGIYLSVHEGDNGGGELNELKRSRWHTAEGITVGTTLREIEKLNGGPVHIDTGFESCAGSGVVDADGGRLTFLGTRTRVGDREGTSDQTLGLALTYEDEVTEAEYEAEYQKLRYVRSDNPAIRRLGWKVWEMRIEFQ